MLQGPPFARATLGRRFPGRYFFLAADFLAGFLAAGFRAGFLAAGFFGVAFFFAAAIFFFSAATHFFAAAFSAVSFFFSAAIFFFSAAIHFLAAAFWSAIHFFAAALSAAIFLAAVCLAVGFFDAAFLAAGFLAAGFLAAGFFAAGFLAGMFLPPRESSYGRIIGPRIQVRLGMSRAQGLATDPWGNERVGFSAGTTIDRRDFGLSWNQALETGGVLVGTVVKISLEIQAVRDVS